MTDHQQELSHQHTFSDGYHTAMEKIEIELIRRDPRYRDPYHHNWDIFSAPCSIEERRLFIVNTISCAMVRNSAILAHSILGTRDPDAKTSTDWRLPSTDWRLPINRLLSAILYQTPIHYIESQGAIWFNLYSGIDKLGPGYQVSYKDIMLMVDFADIADAISFVQANQPLGEQ